MLLQVARFSCYFQVDPSERDDIQNKVKEAQVQLQVAKETLSKYRERENDLRADEVSVGRQLVCIIFHPEVICVEFLLAWPSREKG